MKNLLLASTALVAFAGAAAAEVAISGSGRMGIVYDKSIVNDDLVRNGGTITRSSDAGMSFNSRVRVAFTLTQETDAGDDALDHPARRGVADAHGLVHRGVCQGRAQSRDRDAVFLEHDHGGRHRQRGGHHLGVGALHP